MFSPEIAHPRRSCPLYGGFYHSGAGYGKHISINPAYFYRNELQYYTSYCQVHQFGRAVDAMDTGKVKTDRLITRLYPLEEFPQAIEDVLDHNVLKLVIRPNGMED